MTAALVNDNHRLLCLVRAADCGLFRFLGGKKLSRIRKGQGAQGFWMKRVPIFLLVLLAAACGESKPPPTAEHTQLIKACVSGGGDQTHCECQATKLDELVAAKEIDPAVYRMMILQAEGKDEEAEAAYSALDYSQALQPATAGEAMAACDAGG